MLNNENSNNGTPVLISDSGIKNASVKLKSDRIDGKKYKGLLVLFDIIDSTLRKENYKAAWHYQTTFLYHILNEFYTKFKKEAGSGIANSPSTQILNPKGFMIKFSGDGCMMFFTLTDVYSVEELRKTTQRILDDVHSLKLEIESNDTDFKDIALKTVLTFLDDCYQVKTGQGIDYLGKGIDFSFRLEKFGRSIYYVVNSRFISALTGEVINLNDLQSPQIDVWVCLPLARFLKGWNEKQVFFVIFQKEMLKDSGANFISPHATDAGPEILQHLISTGMSFSKSEDREMISTLTGELLDSSQQENNHE